MHPTQTTSTEVPLDFKREILWDNIHTHHWCLHEIQFFWERSRCGNCSGSKRSWSQTRAQSVCVCLCVRVCWLLWRPCGMGCFTSCVLTHRNTEGLGTAHTHTAQITCVHSTISRWEANKLMDMHTNTALPHNMTNMVFCSDVFISSCADRHFQCWRQRGLHQSEL